MMLKQENFELKQKVAEPIVGGENEALKYFLDRGAPIPDPQHINKNWPIEQQAYVVNYLHRPADVVPFQPKETA
jgi:hypothetical protein